MIVTSENYEVLKAYLTRLTEAVNDFQLVAPTLEEFEAGYNTGCRRTMKQIMEYIKLLEG